ncbi:MAG: amylo-alpha-1,6-glucosidase [Gemmatimonadaceae bacterium]
MTTTVARRIRVAPVETEALGSFLAREWLVTNGLGGYASSTVAGVNTRRYHGVLVAALPNPYGRMVMLSHVVERVVTAGGDAIVLSGEERVGGRLEVPSVRWLAEFRLDRGLPVWEYRLPGVTIEKRCLLPHRQNTVHLTYRVLEADGYVQLELSPLVHFRSYEAPVSTPHLEPYRLTVADAHHEITAGELPPLRLSIQGGDAQFVAEPRRADDFIFRVEEARGYEYSGALWSPGHFHMTLAADESAALVASTESPEVMNALTPKHALLSEHERRRRLLVTAPGILHEGVGAELVLAAEQFIIIPAGRRADTARAWATGDEIHTIIAGYHWFTDWGRDTMISLEGLTLATGRHREAGAILRAFAHYVRDGLIPNLFPDGSDEGLYHTADATLWFFHAVHRYLERTGDREILPLLLPTLVEIYERHRAGTRFGIGMDPEDGLLRQGAEGYQLTWMDAKVEDWVVTPRRGKAVEINALWHNALCLLASWLREEGGETLASRVAETAALVRRSFNHRFWYDTGGYLYDVVDGPHGDSAECRPNQLFAISLDHPVLERARWEPVVRTVKERLLTPVGLRSLAPGSEEYKPQYCGDLRARDAAYHQGTVWGWLIGPWIDAWLKVHPEQRREARRYLDGLIDHLDEFGVGSLAEIFDAEHPYTPRGCIAQAWSVAEVLRCFVRTEA